jgi:chromosome segregation ATPase
MTGVRADIGALREMRAALDRFQYEQRNLLDAATHEIEVTRASLERTAENWRLRKEQLEREIHECDVRAAAAAEHGGYIDCSPLHRAHAEAVERLTNVGHWRMRVEDEVAVFSVRRSQFHECLEIDVRHAIAHLDEVIKALAAVRATKLADT